MNTPTHLLVTGVVFTRAHDGESDFSRLWQINAVALAGALVPDAFIYVLYVWARLIQGLPETTVWRELYWQNPWQLLGAISNSVPLYAGLLAIGIWRRSLLLSIFGGAALLHMGMDFFVHHDDAHRHFWPLTEWRFRSPVSYWDPAHFGATFMVIEAAIGVCCVALLWRRHASRTVRGALVLPLVLYLAVPAYFIYATS